MSIKLPAKLTSAWWKENKPKSLPKSEIEDLLQTIGQKTFAEKKKLIDNLAAGSNDLTAPQFVKPYKDLITELKRFQAVVHKAKHDDFVKAIDSLIATAKTEKDDLETRLVAAKKRSEAESSKLIKGDTSQKKDDKDDTKVKVSSPAARKKEAERVKTYIEKKMAEFNDRDKLVQDVVRKTIADIAASSAKATTEQDFRDVFGRNRFVFNWLKDSISRVKGERETFDDLAKQTGGDDAEIANFYKALESRNSLAKALKVWQETRDQSKDLDKNMLKLCVAKLGKDKTAEVFTSTKPIGVKLALPKVTTDAKEFKLKLKA